MGASSGSRSGWGSGSALGVEVGGRWAGPKASGCCACSSASCAACSAASWAACSAASCAAACRLLCRLLRGLLLSGGGRRRGCGVELVLAGAGELDADVLQVGEPADQPVPLAGEGGGLLLRSGRGVAGGVAGLARLVGRHPGVLERGLGLGIGGLGLGRRCVVGVEAVLHARLGVLQRRRALEHVGDAVGLADRAERGELRRHLVGRGHALGVGRALAFEVGRGGLGAGLGQARGLGGLVRLVARAVEGLGGLGRVDLGGLEPLLGLRPAGPAPTRRRRPWRRPRAWASSTCCWLTVPSGPSGSAALARGHREGGDAGQRHPTAYSGAAALRSTPMSWDRPLPRADLVAHRSSHRSHQAIASLAAHESQR